MSLIPEYAVESKQYTTQDNVVLVIAGYRAVLLRAVAALSVAVAALYFVYGCYGKYTSICRTASLLYFTRSVLTDAL